MNKSSSRFAELDGLRALAIIPVILFHMDISGIANAGFFGVDIFFTISGFIITATLVQEYRKDGAFDFVNFYVRRLKRLLPPVFGLILFALLVTPILSPDAYAKLRADVGAALLYASNWWQIYEKQSYFDTTPHVLKHLWSLAVEEQFYFAWPPLAYLCLKKLGARATGVIAFVLALASTGWMFYQFTLNATAADYNRIYLGTDTHAMGLLVGAALACFWNPWAEKTTVPAERHGWRAGALVSLGALGAMVQSLNPSDPATYEGSFLLVPLLSAVVIYCLMNDSRFVVSRWLRTDVLQWIGLRSYSLYLVHWAVFVWMQLLGFTHFSHPAILVGGLAVVALLSELMYRTIEMPSKRFDPKTLGSRQVWGTVAAYAGCVACALLFLMPAQAPRVADDEQPLQAAVAVQCPDSAAPGKPAIAAGTPGKDAPDLALHADEVISGGEDILAIGDSVLKGASAHLSRAIPGIDIDAAVGRQASAGLKVLQEEHATSKKTPTVLVHLGTNGYINEGQFRALLTALADRKSVIVVNVHADRRWTEPNNEIIGRMAHAFRNVRLIDWNAVSSGHADYFGKDGIHLTRKGILALTAEIKVATGGSVIIAPPATRTMLAHGPSTQPVLRTAAAATPPPLLVPLLVPRNGPQNTPQDAPANTAPPDPGPENHAAEPATAPQTAPATAPASEPATPTHAAPPA